MNAMNEIKWEVVPAEWTARLGRWTAAVVPSRESQVLHYRWSVSAEGACVDGAGKASSPDEAMARAADCMRRLSRGFDD